jgi:hypothetical protein
MSNDGEEFVTCSPRDKCLVLPDGRCSIHFLRIDSKMITMKIWRHNGRGHFVIRLMKYHVHCISVACHIGTKCLPRPNGFRNLTKHFWERQDENDAVNYIACCCLNYMGYRHHGQWRPLGLEFNSIKNRHEENAVRFEALHTGYYVGITWPPLLSHRLLPS